MIIRNDNNNNNNNDSMTQSGIQDQGLPID